jgi:hypothetical protein
MADGLDAASQEFIDWAQAHRNLTLIPVLVGYAGV